MKAVPEGKKIMAESVARREEINSEAKESKRKPNLSVYEIGMITENVKKDLETIQSKLTMSPAKRKKKSGRKLRKMLMQWVQQTVRCPR